MLSAWRLSIRILWHKPLRRGLMPNSLTREDRQQNAQHAELSLVELISPET
jgi:hypothetical protein